MAEPVLYDLGVLIATVTALTIVGSRFGQPNVLSYLLAGILLGPILGTIGNHTFIETLSTLGVSFLLFLVGIRIDLGELHNVGKASLAVAAVQMSSSAVLGYLIATLFGMPLITSLYIALAATFSSTVVVVKILEEQDELDTLYGRIDVGVLLIQDLIVILALAIITTLGSSVATDLTQIGLEIGRTAGFGLLIVGGALAASRYLLPHLFDVFAESEEAFFVSSVGWFMLLITISEMASLSVEIGGFLAGLSLAQLPYSQELKERVRPLTDVFVAFFFTSLGLQLSLGVLIEVLIPAIVLSVGVMILKPLTIFGTLLKLRYRVRTSFMAGITMAQISEFSLILAALGSTMGHIGAETVALLTVTAILTIGASSFLVRYNKTVYDLLEDHLTTFQPSNLKEMEEPPEELSDHIIILGGHVQGHQLLQRLTDEGEDVLVVDYNPNIIKNLLENGHNAIYGDIGDLKARKDMHLHNAKLLVSTIPSVDDTKLIISKAKEHDVPCVVKADSVDTALELYDHGADYVIFSDMLSAKQVVENIEQALNDRDALEEAREKHAEHLKDEKISKSRLYEVLNQ
jgi:Kef-type K+ transport system membrane component KefB/Trk K+ transport system NAD-binding subunit